MSDIFSDRTIRRLGALKPRDRRLIRKLHDEGKPPGFIFGWVEADRSERGTDEQGRQPLATQKKTRTR